MSSVKVSPYLLIGIAILAISLLAFPYLSQWYFLAAGHNGLQKTTALLEDTRTVFCRLDQTLPEEIRADFDAYVQSLERAVEINPRSAQPFLLLGSAYCRQGNPDMAIQAFTRYSELRDKNPLGHLGLALSYEAKCVLIEESANFICKNPALLEKIRNEFASAEITEDMLVNSGTQAFSEPDYSGASRLFRWASYLSDSLPSSTFLYRWRLSAALAGESLPFPEVEPWEVFLLDGFLEIPATELRWQIQKPELNLQLGDRLIDHPGKNRDVGIMWWRGSAIALVDVKKPGRYQLILHAQDTPPGPLQLQIEKDLKPVDLFELSNADDSWKNLQSEVEFTAGFHLIGVRFMEDRGDVVLKWLRFNYLSSGSGE